MAFSAHERCSAILRKGELVHTHPPQASWRPTTAGHTEGSGANGDAEAVSPRYNRGDTTAAIEQADDIRAEDEEVGRRRLQSAAATCRLACRRPWAESAVAAAWPAVRSRPAGTAACCCPRTPPPVAARLAPSAAGRSDVLRPERSARSRDILAQGDNSACSQRHRPAWLSYSYTSARS